MFQPHMIAPCGLDCALCAQAHRPDHPCPGCLGPDEHKPEFCSTRCEIIRCEQRRQHQYRFCDACPDFPCAHTQEREARYQTQYALTESPFANLTCIREAGMTEFLRQEAARWTCRDCGGVISVHDGLCSRCRRPYRRGEPGAP